MAWGVEEMDHALLKNVLKNADIYFILEMGK